MQQHPIPQNVTQYQFRLVGDMTLKQFLELMGGIILAYLFFASNLIFIIKWPLVILSILLGAGLAFFPVEDRPLDQWITAFIKAIYQPTRFTWQKTNKVPRLFEFERHSDDTTTTITKTIKAPPIVRDSKPVSDLSDTEAEQVSSITSLLAGVGPSATPHTPSHAQLPIDKPSVTVRSLKREPSNIIDLSLNTPTEESIHVEKSDYTKQIVDPIQKTENVVFSAPSVTQPQNNIVHETAKVVPQTIPTKTLPPAPKSAGLITGVVLSSDGKLVDGAIVQILSIDGVPQRALKTNSLGQFYTSTPLAPGNYAVEVDKAGHQFDPLSLTISSAITPPIELHATKMV